MAGETYDGLSKPRLWSYVHTDAMATVRAANYVTTAKLKRMRVGDYVFVTQMTGAAVTAVTLAVVMAVATAGADLSDGTAITVTNT
ncbi:MAG: hypothetical protein H0U59_09385 [Gemmatimonadaceae bacterium]|nr:hypothetical protein [Gemmatimonadaceae bacterium]